MSTNHQKPRENDPERRELALNLDVGAPLKPTVAKLTRTKRKKLLQKLAEGWNLTQAASSVGVTRQAVSDLVERDEKFKLAYQAVLDAHVDLTEDVMFTIACDTSHRSVVQAGKIILEANRKEIYGRNPEVQVNVQVNTIQATSELANLARQIPEDKDK